MFFPEEHRPGDRSAFMVNNMYPVKYTIKPIYIYKVDLNNFAYDLPIMIVMALPNFASLTTANRRVEM